MVTLQAVGSKPVAVMVAAVPAEAEAEAEVVADAHRHHLLDAHLHRLVEAADAEAADAHHHLRVVVAVVTGILFANK